MKISDIFSALQKGGQAADGGKGGRLIQPVQPVGQTGRLNLMPGQLLQGEVMGEDGQGQLLLKLAGEIIAARTPVKLAVGQQLWFEVKEAGDSPLLQPAGRQGAVQDLLKNIMAIRPLLVAAPAPPAAGEASTAPPQAVFAGARGQESAPLAAPGGAALPAASDAVAPAPGTPAMPPPAVLGSDGTLPPEAARLVRALAAFSNQAAAAAGPAPAAGGLAPSPSLIKTIVALVREGQVPAALQRFEAFQGVVRSAPPPAVAGGDTALPPAAAARPEGAGPVAGVAPPLTGVEPENPSPRLTSSFSPPTIRILNSLLAVAAIKAPGPGDTGPLQPALDPEANLAAILTQIGREGKVPPSLLRLGPLQALLAPGPAGPLSSGQASAPVAAEEELAGQVGLADRPLLPLQFAAAQQGAEPLPAPLRLLAALLGLGSFKNNMELRQELDQLFGRLAEAELPGTDRKLAAFFEAHARVNGEPAPGPSHFYIMPALFAGQAGWGEWLWSQEKADEGTGAAHQENLVFFLEMSQLGALTIQVILKGKKMRGQILMEDKKGRDLVAALLPGLCQRLEAFGYDIIDFPCLCQPLNVMQELKESLHRQAGTAPVSLLDVQA